MLQWSTRSTMYYQRNMPEIQITITLACAENIDGLGIGLYQASKHAALFDYELNLINNQAGRVCFELTSKRDAEID